MEFFSAMVFLVLGALIFVGGGIVAYRKKSELAPKPVSDAFLLKGALIIFGLSWAMGVCSVVNSNSFPVASVVNLREALGWGLAQGVYFYLAGLTVFSRFPGRSNAFLTA